MNVRSILPLAVPCLILAACGGTEKESTSAKGITASGIISVTSGGILLIDCDGQKTVIVDGDLDGIKEAVMNNRNTPGIQLWAEVTGHVVAPGDGYPGFVVDQLIKIEQGSPCPADLAGMYTSGDEANSPKAKLNLMADGNAQFVVTSADAQGRTSIQGKWRASGNSVELITESGTHVFEILDGKGLQLNSKELGLDLILLRNAGSERR